MALLEPTLDRDAFYTSKDGAGPPKKFSAEEDDPLAAATEADPLLVNDPKYKDKLKWKPGDAKSYWEHAIKVSDAQYPKEIMAVV